MAFENCRQIGQLVSVYKEAMFSILLSLIITAPKINTVLSFYNMLALLTEIYNYIFHKDQYFILIMGLDNAGKTTFLESAKAKLNKQYKAMKPEAITTTVGLNIGKVVFDGVQLNFWDLGGQKELQSLWDKYFAEAHGVIYIIDSSDQSRIEESLDAFEKALKNQTLNGVPVVIVCNKQDIKECMSVSDVKMALREIIKKLGTRDCSLFPVSALHGNNVLASISWLVKAIKKNSDYRPPS
ncbi:ADP-ribosylation factor-related protein 1 [Trichinella britovi]|uniref:ADP-ribosylation factor-like protein 6 n=4 Tax=Trichinella TaxID=6333 RepID=A0A0V1D7I7_TRIBR|nr:ADP-ribosylation factor-related protein 1 [Trichinella britovi]